MPPRAALVFLVHLWHEALARRFERIRRETASGADCFVLLDRQADVEGRWRDFLAGIGAPDSLVPFAVDELPAQLGFRYFGLQRVLANAHFPLLWFARSRPEYTHVWQVEYDVEYRGNWGELFATYGSTDADLVAAHFHRWSDWPDWFWWPSLSMPPQAQVSAEQLYKAFLPVMRLSRRAIGAIERAHREGWMGHFEAVVPTVLLHDGQRLEDLNARGKSYAGWYQDPVGLLPLLSTIRCRPYVTQQEFLQRGQGPLLFHPVKEPWTWDGQKVVNW